MFRECGVDMDLNEFVPSFAGVEPTIPGNDFVEQCVQVVFFLSTFFFFCK